MSDWEEMRRKGVTRGAEMAGQRLGQPLLPHHPPHYRLHYSRQLPSGPLEELQCTVAVIPQLGLCLGAVSLWQKCVGQGSSTASLLRTSWITLSTAFSSILPEMVSSMADKCSCVLIERVLDQRLPRRGSSRDGVMVTLFQLWSYVEANFVSDMKTHITELAEEECSLRREGLHAVAKLLKDPRGKVSASASSVLRSLAAQPRQREQALVSCLELLEDVKWTPEQGGSPRCCQTNPARPRRGGEDGHRHVETSQDSIPRLFAPGSMASTAF
ncbi:unnamed protein product [Pleuronectes platessa]|uniref:Uncharacterized protein n=1 Tax=Pleuronectes platessa TaxID=8262 RepID=A0A9N7YUA2_PLEPL|nr:unnamed protein product [Pleuronectes platessa]